MKTKIAAVIALAMMTAPVMAQNLDSQVFHNSQHVKAVELSQTEMRETQGELLPLVALALGGAAIGMWTEHGISYMKNGRPASIDEVSKAGIYGAAVGTAGRVAATRWGVPKIGGEINIGNNIRIAPIGNSTGHQLGKFPHYHRRVMDKLGNTKPGQGIGRHRPWEQKPSDKSWRDRF